MPLEQPSFEQASRDLSGEKMEAVRANRDLDELRANLVRDARLHIGGFSADSATDVEDSAVILYQALRNRLNMSQAEAEAFINDIIQREHEDKEDATEYRPLEVMSQEELLYNSLNDELYEQLETIKDSALRYAEIKDKGSFEDMHDIEYVLENQIQKFVARGGEVMPQFTAEEYLRLAKRQVAIFSNLSNHSEKDHKRLNTQQIIDAEFQELQRVVKEYAAEKHELEIALGSKNKERVEELQTLLSIKRQSLQHSIDGFARIKSVVEKKPLPDARREVEKMSGEILNPEQQLDFKN